MNIRTPRPHNTLRFAGLPGGAGVILALINVLVAAIFPTCQASKTFNGKGSLACLMCASPAMSATDGVGPCDAGSSARLVRASNFSIIARTGSIAQESWRILLVFVSARNIEHGNLAVVARVLVTALDFVCV